MKNNWKKMRRLIISFGVFGALIAFLGIGYYAPEAQEIIKKDSVYKNFNKRDIVTDAIRDKSKDFVKIKISSPNDRAKIEKLGTIVEDYGSMIVLAKDKSKKLSDTDLEIQALETTINLPAGKFEPVGNKAEGNLEAETLQSKKGENYYVVQLGGLTKDEWLESFEEVGAEVIQYVPHQAFFVYGNGEAIEKIVNHSRVRWVGQYKEENKLSKELNNFVGKMESEKASFDVAVFSRANLDSIRNEISNTIGGKILNSEKLPHNFFNVIRVEMSPSEIENVARLKDVFRIDPYVKAVREDERAAQIVAGNYSSPTVINPPGYNPLSQFGVDGTNVTVGVSDDGVSIPGNGGLYITSANTINGPLRGAAPGAESGHGHINASIIAGSTPFGVLDPLGYNYGRGIAPNANIVNIPFLSAGNTTTDAQSVDDTVNTAGPNGVQGTIINGSWGAGTNSNAYDSRAAAWDGYVQDASFAATIDPINVIFSAGNSGTSGLTRPKMAKNVIAVGNSDNIRPEISSSADNIDDIRSTSSRGPAADGRIKPDITAPGSYISGSRAGDGSGVSGQIDANHSYSVGTSHSAPQVAGAAALFTQYWKNNNAGKNPPPSLVKAAILNTGQEMNGIGSGSSLPNGDEGWGRLNLKFMLNTGVPTKYIAESVEFGSPGNNVNYNGVIADSTKPVRIALVWTDPPASSDPALVNNLDLTVTIGSNVYRGNVFSGGISQIGGSSDTKNNIENIRLPAGIPAGTPIVININAAALNGNGILGNSDNTDQNFSLVAYNYTEQAAAPRKTAFDYDGDNKADLSIFRSAGGQWWINRSQTSSTIVYQFGASSDKIVPADYTGDGKTDVAIFRPSTSEWFVLRSEDSTFYSFPFGASGDIPAPGDFDGDGKADPAVFRGSSGTWFIQTSSQGTRIEGFGINGDVPVVGDYDGDGKADKAIFRQSNGQWWLSRSTAGVVVYAFGIGTDKTVQGDYTGDGKTDVANFRSSTNQWFILRSEDTTFYSFPFGANGDIPAPADYDGDGKFDAGIFRPSNATWFISGSTAGQIISGFGLNGDIPTQSSYVR